MPHRERGLELFEKLLNLGVWRVRETLLELDRRLVPYVVARQKPQAQTAWKIIGLLDVMHGSKREYACRIKLHQINGYLYPIFSIF